GYVASLWASRSTPLHRARRSRPRHDPSDDFRAPTRVCPPSGIPPGCTPAAMRASGVASRHPLATGPVVGPGSAADLPDAERLQTIRHGRVRYLADEPPVGGNHPVLEIEDRAHHRVVHSRP